MDFEKEERFDESIKYINGGFNGIVKTLADYCLLQNTDCIKNQLLKGDEFIFKLNDLDRFVGVHQFVESLAFGILGEPNFDFNPFKGRIDMFDPGTPMQKSLKFIDNAELEDYEKEDIKKVLLEDRYENSAYSQLLNIYDDYIGHIMPNVNNYLTDFSIEKEYRKKKFRQLLERLETAIQNNKDLDKNAPKHLSKYVAIMNPKFLELKEVLLDEFKEYLPSEEQFDLGESKQMLLADLIDGQRNLDAFLRYEKKLLDRGFLNKELNKWLGKPKLFIRFYCYCENKKMFKYKHEGKTSGVKKLREIYNFKDGVSLDYPNKRKKETNLSTDYFFLDI